MGRLHIAFTAAAVCAAAAAAAPAAQARTAPSGTAFYTPPSGTVSGTHGSVIWSRKQTGSGVLSASGTHLLVLYRSSGALGKSVPVSGSISLPKGKAPKGGWPILTWAHGTTGIADQCAPTRDPSQTKYAGPTLNRFLRAGYAVLQTDYEGLGTPGDHPYLVGLSEGHSVLDIARAARKLEPGKLSKTLFISGHSQGGQAALFAAAQAPRYTPEFKLAGTVAFAPASHLSEQASLLGALTTPSPITALAATILRGLDIAKVGVDVPSILSPQALALYPQTLTQCLSRLAQTDSFGGLAPAALPKQGTDLAPVSAAIDKTMDPENLTIKTPVRIEQGSADTTVFPMFTDQLETQLKAKGTPLTAKSYAGVDHVGVVAKGATDALSYIERRAR